jgi:hypothetical protein
MRYPHKCAKCNHRQSLARKITEYIRPPKCNLCGSSKWYLDKYRINNRNKSRGKVCHCDGYPFPHRLSSGFNTYQQTGWGCKYDL